MRRAPLSKWAGQSHHLSEEPAGALTQRGKPPQARPGVPLDMGRRQPAAAPRNTPALFRARAHRGEAPGVHRGYEQRARLHAARRRWGACAHTPCHSYACGCLRLGRCSARGIGGHPHHGPARGVARRLASRDIAWHSTRCATRHQARPGATPHGLMAQGLHPSQRLCCHGLVFRCPGQSLAVSKRRFPELAGA